MAQATSDDSSLLSRFSIRQKLISAFLVIGLLILTQSFVSLSSSNLFADNYNTIRIQTEVKEVSLQIEQGIQEIHLLADNWLITEPSNQRDLFDDLLATLDEDISRMDNFISVLDNSDLNTDLNVTYAIGVSQSFKSQKGDLVDLVEDRVFTYPSLELIARMESAVSDMYSANSRIRQAIFEVLLYNSTAALDQIVLVTQGSPSSGNASAALFSSLRDLREPMVLIADPVQAVDPDAFGGLNINHTIYQDLTDEFRIIQSTHLDNFTNQIQNIGELRTDSGEIVNFEEAKVLFNKTNQILADVEFVLLNFESLFIDYDTQIADYFSLIEQSVEAVLSDLRDLADWATIERNDLSARFGTLFANQNLVAVLVIFFSILLVIVISFLVNAQISRPVKSITRWSEMISEGDLSKRHIRTGRQDEIGQLQENFTMMNRNLREIIDEVQNSANVISNTSEDLASSSQEINATAEEVSAIAQTMAKGSTEQAEIITTIVQELQDASNVVENVVTQITENLDIIKDLSEQTNILALNTAIEAANAGEYARGFGIISSNIRKMSEQSKQTSRRVSKDSREILEQLRDSFGHISQLIENVASVSEETAASAEEVAASAEEMTASTESVAASSSILSEQSAESLDKVNRFKLT